METSILTPHFPPPHSHALAYALSLSDPTSAPAASGQDGLSVSLALLIKPEEAGYAHHSDSLAQPLRGLHSDLKFTATAQEDQLQRALLLNRDVAPTVDPFTAGVSGDLIQVWDNLKQVRWCVGALVCLPVCLPACLSTLSTCHSFSERACRRVPARM